MELEEDNSVAEICKEDFLNLLRADDGNTSGKLRMLYKISNQHILLEGQARQRVRPAVQLLR